MDRNWESINFGAKLARYRTEDESGRQFPAGPWSIDFLCIEKGTGDLVVVELKRGKTSDATVGQVLRYVSWVKKNLAKDGQKVKGIIIAKEVDEGLSCAVQELTNVEVYTYKVDFTLTPIKK
jgi:RecB family endonuclease NucS